MDTKKIISSVIFVLILISTVFAANIGVSGRDIVLPPLPLDPTDTTTTSVEPPTPTNIKGDADGNGLVNTTDAVIMLKSIVGWDATIVFENADVNSDGRVNTTDVILLLKSIAGHSLYLNN